MPEQKKRLHYLVSYVGKYVSHLSDCSSRLDDCNPASDYCDCNYAEAVKAGQEALRLLSD